MQSGFKRILYPVILFQLAETGSLTEKQQTGTKVAKRLRVEEVPNPRRNQPNKSPMMSMVQLITVTSKFVKNAKRLEIFRFNFIYFSDYSSKTTLTRKRAVAIIASNPGWGARILLYTILKWSPV